MEDIFAVQEDIANRIVKKLKLQVQETSKSEGRTQNMEAYELLLKGSYFLRRGYEGIKKAMEYFQKAVELDHDYAIFWLEKGYRERSGMMVTLKYYWIWNSIRDDPRFIEIYDRMNFQE